MAVYDITACSGGSSIPIDFGVATPRIAVLGLNPHAGDNGVIGNEEQTIIAPAISKALNDGMLVYGPYSADGFFGNETRRPAYHAVLITLNVNFENLYFQVLREHVVKFYLLDRLMHQ